MALRQNIIYIYFKGKHQVTSKSQYQYNRKQYLYFADLNLPQVFEVHFSNRDKGESKTQIGNDKLVEIPDEYFWSGALQIYAWIYLHSGADDSETIYEIRIPLTKRAKPTDEEPLPVQQSAIDKAIAELNNAVNVTIENVNKTESDKIIVANIKDEVVDLKEDIDSTAATINQKAQDAIDASGRAETSALNAADSERKALNYSQQAEQSAQEALESKNIAKQKAEIATGASAEALGYRDEAVNARDIAVQAKQNIVDYRDETKGYRDETLNLKNNVQTLKNQIDETAEEIEDISDSVKEDAQSARQAANSANQSSINASESASQAGQFADGAEQSANQAEQSMNMTEDYKNQSETFKNQAEQFKNQAEEFKNQSETNVSHYPKIVNDYWYVWDATNGEYINTNVDANGIKGDTGNGIASVALNDDYTLTITFTDDTTYTTSSIRGQQGEKGDTGKTGESGVYIGTEEPENEDIKVWIDTDESADSGTVEDLIADITELKEGFFNQLNPNYMVELVKGASANTSGPLMPFRIHAGDSITVTSKDGSNFVNCQFRYYDADKRYVDYWGLYGTYGNKRTFTISREAYYVGITTVDASSPEYYIAVNNSNAYKQVINAIDEGLSEITDNIAKIEKYARANYVQLITGAYRYIDYNTQTGTITIPRDTVYVGYDETYKRYYKVINPSSEIVVTGVTYENMGTSATKLVLDVTSWTFSLLTYTTQLASTQRLVAGIRIPISDHEGSIVSPTPWSIDGKPYGISLAGYDRDFIVKSVNHRGWNAAPENTLVAFKESAKHAYKYVECDVQFTSDGVAVLLHDGTINRTARDSSGNELSSTVNIADITYETALTYDFGIYKGGSYAETKIPSFTDFLKLCRNLSVHPYIELKTGTQAQIESLVSAVKQNGMKGNVTWISFYTGLLSYVVGADSKARVGLLVSAVTSESIAQAQNLRTSDNEVFIDSAGYTTAEVELCVNAELPLEVWTINNASTAIALPSYATGVTTDLLDVGDILLTNAMA